MKRLISIIVVGLLITACGDKVEVPPAHIGKILGKNGYAPDNIPPSKFRLEACITYCDKLVVVEISDSPFKETMKLFMPKDKLNLSVDIRGTMSIPNDKKTISALFDRVPAAESKNGNYHNIVPVTLVYKTYGQQALRGIVRSELVNYTIAEVLQNRDTIGQSIHAALVKKLQETGTPLMISRFELADVQPPTVIVTAQEKAKEREIAVQQAEADARVSMVKAEKDLEIARKERLVKKEEALGIAEQNRIAAKSVTPALLEYRRLEVQEKIMMEMARNGNAMIVPLNMNTSVSEMATFGKILGKEFKTANKQ